MAAFFSWQHAIRSSKLESTTKLVCYTIWSHMASDGTGCFPSYALIAEESGLSRRSVIEHVQKAAQAGFLQVDNRHRDNGSATSNVYRPTMPTGGEPAALGGERGSLGVVNVVHPHNNTSLTDQVTDAPKAPKGIDVVNGAFEDFWKQYPNKVGKPVALKSFSKLKPDTAALMEGLARWKLSASWLKEQGRFIPHPSTFLNQRRWEDVPIDMAQPKSEAQKADDAFWDSILNPNQQKQIA